MSSFAASTMASTISSRLALGTRTRVCATHACPVFIRPVKVSMPAISAGSASASTMAADLPPSSSEQRLSCSPHAAPIALPAAVEPVKVILSTSGCATSALPVSGPPGTTESTPSGRPASVNSSAITLADNGVSGAGLRTTEQPADNAGPSLLQIRNSGTFQAVIAPTTPTGSRVICVFPNRPSRYSCHV